MSVCNTPHKIKLGLGATWIANAENHPILRTLRHHEVSHLGHRRRRRRGILQQLCK